MPATLKVTLQLAAPLTTVRPQPRMTWPLSVNATLPPFGAGLTLAEITTEVPTGGVALDSDNVVVVG